MQCYLALILYKQCWLLLGCASSSFVIYCAHSAVCLYFVINLLNFRVSSFLTLILSMSMERMQIPTPGASSAQVQEKARLSELFYQTCHISKG